MCVVPVKEETEITSDRLDELLAIAGSRPLILATLGADGTIVYLRVQPDIDERALEELANQSVSSHKRRRKGERQNASVDTPKVTST